MDTVYYIQTSDPERVVRVPAGTTLADLMAIQVVRVELPPTAFDLISPLRKWGLAEARYAAKATGLHLVHPDRVAVRRE